jgi:hypothetical protein
MCTGWGLGILAEIFATQASGWERRLSYMVINEEVSVWLWKGINCYHNSDMTHCYWINIETVEPGGMILYREE